MWVMLPEGFYSVAEAPDGELQVRARLWADLRQLELRYSFKFDGIDHTPQMDYQYRGYISRLGWKRVMAMATDSIHYEKFKPECDPIHRHAYNRCWAVLCELNPDEPPYGVPWKG